LYSSWIYYSPGTPNLEYSNKVGVLDLKTGKWNWSPLINKDGSSLKNMLPRFNTIKFNDQLIISQSM
jgi:hypothetical protein